MIQGFFRELKWRCKHVMITEYYTVWKIYYKKKVLSKYTHNTVCMMKTVSLNPKTFPQSKWWEIFKSDT